VSTLLSLLSRLHIVQERVCTILVRSLYEAAGLSCRAFDETKRELLAVESHKALLSDPHTAMLQAKLKLRTPYITPLNILQVPIWQSFLHSPHAACLATQAVVHVHDAVHEACHGHAHAQPDAGASYLSFGCCALGGTLVDGPGCCASTADLQS